MIRSERNAIIINTLVDKLKDLPNVQDIVDSKFGEWFRETVEKGKALTMQGQEVQNAGGGGEEAAPPDSPPPEGAPA